MKMPTIDGLAFMEKVLAEKSTDIVLMDVKVPLREGSEEPYPILVVIPNLLQLYPDLEVLVVSMGANQAVKHEVAGELIRRMDLVVTDDLPTAQTDSGDLIALSRRVR